MSARPPILLLAGLVATLSGCDGLGGSTASIVAPPVDFAIVGRSPAPGREGVPLSASVVITFTKALDPAAAQPGIISANGVTYGTIEISGTMLKFTPVGGWIPGTAYAIALSPDLPSVSGDKIGPVATWGFKTTGDPPVHDTVLAVRSRPR
jgi:hypothetical protein